MTRLQHLAPILVDAGGDIAVSQPKQEDIFWPVGITDPFSPNKTLDLLMISKGGIATSGRDFRSWKMNGKWMHHLIDTRNGLPADTDIVSATVISKNVILSEAVAKCAVILGSGEAVQWLTNQQGIDYLLLLENQRFISSDGYRFLQWNESCQQTTNKK
jgi:thiamine biosynthesis lipoprotein